MMGWWHDFHFLRPWWLLGLSLVPVAYALAARGGRERRELARLVDVELMPYVLQGADARGRAWPPALVTVGMLLCTLALAGPAWNRVASPLYASRSAQVVAVSLSRHMLAHDVAPSRIDRARYKARDLLAANRAGLNGLVAYAGEAFTVAPLTSDVGSLDDLLDALSPDTMPTDGNDAAQAIERGAALIRAAKAGGGDLVLITDGADTSAEAAAHKARGEGVRVSVLGIGTPQGSPVPDGEGGLLRDSRGDVVVAHRDDDALRALAGAGGGHYVPMTEDGRDVAALKPSGLAGSSLMQAEGQGSDEWQDRGPWLLLPLLAVFALAFRRGWLLVLPMIMLPALLPSTAQAGTWSDLWRRPDQQADAALRQGDAKRAQALARDPALQGAAAYRAGNYAAAAQAWQRAPGAEAAYNLGNALAKQGRYEEALAAYDRALKENPGHADAKANRQAVEDWLRKQPPQDKQHGDQRDKQDKHGSGKDADGSKGQPGKDDDQQGNDKKNDQKKSQDASKDGQQGENADARRDANSKGEQNGQGPEKSGQGEAKPPSAAEQAEQKAKAEQARQALQQQMNQALREGKAKDGESSHELGAVAADDPQAKLPADVRRALQRVPDDPGALLRRKFELEYRQRHGGAGEDDR